MSRLFVIIIRHYDSCDERAAADVLSPCVLRFSELLKWFKTGGVLITGKELFCKLVETADRDIAADEALLEAERAASERAADGATDETGVGDGTTPVFGGGAACSVHTGNGALTSPRAEIAKKAKRGRTVRKYLLNPGERSTSKLSSL